MLEKIQEIMDVVFWGNALGSYMISAGVITAGLVVLAVLKKIFLSYLAKKGFKAKNPGEELLVKSTEKSIFPILYVLIFYFGLSFINFHPKAAKIIDVAAVILFTVFAIRFLTRFVNFIITVYWLNKHSDETKIRSVQGLMIIVKALIWGIGIILVLDNLGYKVSTIVAGLGIGGIAVALAAQAVLGDVFSYFSIMFDKPFEVGDFIIIDGHMGTIETIGVKTTRIRSLSGEELIFSNSDLTNSRVRNYKRMQTRRVVFTVGVTYDTGKEKLAKIGGMIKEIIEGMEGVRFDRSNSVSYTHLTLPTKRIV